MSYSTFASLAILLSCTSLAYADSGNLGRPVVVELYTSQGCSSCPPADKFLLELKKDQSRNILPLSFHVDYWNSLGWKDTFSDPSFSDRQRKYARYNGSPTIYTPQMVINGEAFVVGSRRNEVNSLIDGFISKSKKDSTANLPWLKNCKDSAVRRITVEGSPQLIQDNGYTLYFLTIRKHIESVKISRGENARRNISYGNVVQRIEKLNWSDAQNRRVEFNAKIDDNAQTGIVLLQEDNFGPIIDAVEIVDTDCAELDRHAQFESKLAADVAELALGVSVWTNDFPGGGSFVASVASSSTMGEFSSENSAFPDSLEAE